MECDIYAYKCMHLDFAWSLVDSWYRFNDFNNRFAYMTIFHNHVDSYCIFLALVKVAVIRCPESQLSVPRLVNEW